MTIRLTTNAPISYIVDEVPFEIDETNYFLLMPDESLKEALQDAAEKSISNTLGDWESWVRTLSIPFEWQDEVLRACITLKMGNFEETGAIVAAMTTSIPTSPQADSCYDYRYCWLRDAFWVVIGLNRVGATHTMEAYLRFLNNIVANFQDQLPVDDSSQTSNIQPVYGISLETRLYEREMHRLLGYRGLGPVRLGNKDSEAIQNDVYGAVILALTQVFFDRRLRIQGDADLFSRLEKLGNKAIQVYNKPDSGPRGRKLKKEVHTYSSVMCWAACDRLAKISNRLNLPERKKHWDDAAKMIQKEIMTKAWNEKLKSFVSVWEGDTIDAYLLQLPELRFISATDEKYLSTLNLVEKTLRKKDVITFSPNDDFGLNSASFWYINVLVDVGRKEEARQLFEQMLSKTHHGMLSETIDINTSELWGNFPQSSAMVGLILCAIRLSRDWNEAF